MPQRATRVIHAYDGARLPQLSCHRKGVVADSRREPKGGLMAKAGATKTTRKVTVRDLRVAKGGAVKGGRKVNKSSSEAAPQTREHVEAAPPR